MKKKRFETSTRTLLQAVTIARVRGAATPATTKLENSRRTLLQAVYTPVRVHRRNVNWTERNPARAYAKWSLLGSLMPSKGELDGVRRRLDARRSEAPGRPPTEALLNALSTVEAVLPHRGGSNAVEGARRLSSVSQTALATIAEDLIRHRSGPTRRRSSRRS